MRVVALGVRVNRLKTLGFRAQTIASRLTVQDPESWRSGMSGNERGYTYQWQQARLRHLQMHPLCVMCEAEGRYTSASVVDHRIPHRGDEAKFWDQSNWQSLCAHHHSSAKQREEQSGRGYGGAI